MNYVLELKFCDQEELEEHNFGNNQIKMPFFLPVRLDEELEEPLGNLRENQSLVKISRT